MTHKTARHHYLDFEKPIAEIEDSIARLTSQHAPDQPDISREIAALRGRLERVRDEIYAHLAPWQRVQIARHPARPYCLDYAAHCCEEFIELRGDRSFSDDRSIVGGFARLGAHRIMLIGHQKGRDTKERTLRNFGMAHPEGYRKALRLMRLASKFGVPIVTLVDTPGAYPGIGAEERGQAEAIARSTDCCLNLGVPIIAVVVGEGGSGGAIAIATANRILMLEHAIYSVISPEGAASIIWRDSNKKEEAATNMKITAQDLDQLGVIDVIVKEPVGGAHRDRSSVIISTGNAIARALAEFDGKSAEEIRKQRHDRFLSIGR